MAKSKLKKPSLLDVVFNLYLLPNNEIREKVLKVDPLYFYEYYEGTGWTSKSGNPIKSWRGKMSIWSIKNKAMRMPELLTKNKWFLESPHEDSYNIDKRTCRYFCQVMIGAMFVNYSEGDKEGILQWVTGLVEKKILDFNNQFCQEIMSSEGHWHWYVYQALKSRLRKDG